MLDKSKREFHQGQIADCDDRQLFRLVDKMSNPSASETRALPDFTSAKTLANEFAEFFDRKIKTLRGKMDSIDSPPLSVHIEDAYVQAPLPTSEQCLKKKFATSSRNLPQRHRH